MGKHHRHSKDRKDSRKKRRRSHSTTPSCRDEDREKRQEERIKQLELLVEQYNGLPLSQLPISERMRSQGREMRRGDELLIPMFDPKKDDITVEQWLEQIDKLAEKFKWDECAIMRLIVTRLAGHAKEWFDAQRQGTASWSDTKAALIETFKKAVPFAKLIKEAVNYEAKPGQEIGDYCFHKLNKLRLLKIMIPDEYVIDMVLYGLNNDDIARTVRAARQTTPSALYNHMLTIGKMPNNANKPSDHKEQTRTGGHHNSRYEKKDRRDKSDIKCFKCNELGHIVKECTKSRMELDEKKDKQHSWSSIVCYRCNGKGHMARECKKTGLKCTNCHRFGHSSDKCFNKKKGEVNAVRVREDACTNNYVIKVRVNGYKINGLVDTGSARTLILSSIIENWNLVRSAIPETTLRGFAGGEAVIKESVNVVIVVQQATARVDALILPDIHMPYDCVIGRDFLNQEHVVLIKSRNKLVIKQVDTKEIKLNDDVDVNYGDVLTIGDTNLEHLDSVEKQQCKELLEEYKDRVTTSLQDIGRTETTCMEIKCLSETPVVYRPYRLSEFEKGTLRKMIQELLDNNIIRESNSPYASPVILVRKKTGDYRMCVDYRKLNAITVRDKYPLPLIEEQIDRLGGNRYFTGLDLASGYYQVPMAEHSIEKTAFVTPEGHYEFLRMPFGLTNAPAVFQRMMNTVLGSLKYEIAFPYIDDIIIPSKTVEEGIQRLRQVLQALREHNLTLRLSKCTFFEQEIEYLGREINKDGVRPGRRKIEAVLKMKDPTTVPQLRQFLGLAGYFRKFIQGYATVVEPLTQLLRKNVEWIWTEAQKNAVTVIKTKLTTRPILAIFDASLVTELHTDASARGIGAMLMQWRDKELVVVAYYSKQTTKDQQCYHSYELETMAVVLALRYFRVYLLGLNFKVVTDCNALRTTFSRRDLIPRIGRWWLEVQDYTFEIEYRPGTKMTHVDALSRNAIFTLEVSSVDLTEADWLLAAQLQDEQLARIKEILGNKQRNNETKHYFKEYLLKKGLVYRQLGDEKVAWVVPRNARLQICRLCHDEAGHLSAEKTIERIRRNYWFAGMRRFVDKYVKACLSCAYYKDTTGKRQGKLHVIEKTPVPFHTLHIDHVGPFINSRRNNKYLLVIVDGFTKFVIIEPVKSLKTRHTVKILLDVICLFGCPARIVSDRGTTFISHSFDMFCKTYGIKHVLNAVATPRANGQCERYNKTIVSALATTSAGGDSKNWDQNIKRVQSALNTMQNSSINTTPVKALIGCDVKSAAEAYLLKHMGNKVERVDLKVLREAMKQHITLEQQKQKEYYDKSRREAKKYSEGELVMVRITSIPATGESRKLAPKFKGPFRIHKVLRNDRYAIEDLREGSKRGYTVAAADHLKPWVTLQVEEGSGSNTDDEMSNK